MINLKLVLKIIAMNILFALVAVYSRLFRKKIENIASVAVLFLPPLGIGDLVMLSPAIQKIADVFPNAKVSLITWIAPVVEFKDIDFVSYQAAKNFKFDLVISPTLNLHHLPFIFRAKYWLGYFTKNCGQSNFLNKNFKYDLRSEHYIWRTIRLVRALDRAIGDNLELEIRRNNLSYPNLLESEPECFKTTLGQCRYLVLGVLSKWPDRQWPVDRFVAVVSWLVDNNYVDKVVMIGDSSKSNYDLSMLYEERLKKYSSFLVNMTGKTRLPETAFIIHHSLLYLGLDSGPAHFAYALAPKVVALFITVQPELRLPFLKDLSKRVATVYTNTGQPSLYNGISPVGRRAAKTRALSISIDQVKSCLMTALK